MVNYVKKIFQSTEKKILYLLAALVSFMTVDGILTQYFVPRGSFREANTFMAPLVGQPSFLIIKIVGAFICAALLWDISRRYPKMGLIATWVAVVGCGVIVLWNISLMLLV